MNAPSLPASLWAATARPAPATAALKQNLSYDVAVVGGGFAGLRTALELARAGTGVCVLEAGDIGWGASGRNGGQVNPIGHEAPSVVARHWQVAAEHEQVQRYVRFTIGAADELFELVRTWHIECDAAQNGWIRAVHGTAARAEFERLYEGWRSAGAALRLLDSDEVAQLSGTRCYVGGWLAERGGSVQPLSYARGLARAALGAGAHIYTGTGVTELNRAGLRWQLACPGGTIDADTVVLCSNGYTDGLFKGLRETVVPAIPVQAATAPLTPAQTAEILPQRHTFADTRRVIFYFRKTADDRLVFGTAGTDADDPGASDRRRIIDGLRTVYPQFPDLDVDYLWGGRIAVTLDHLPHVHELAPGLIAGLGCNGRGVALATAMGRQLSDWVLERDGKDLAIPVTPMRTIPLHRFHRIGARAAVWWKTFRDRQEAHA